MLNGRHYWGSWLRQRESGSPRYIGFNDKQYEKLYSSMRPCNAWDPPLSSKSSQHGSVFNLEFSPDGSVLVAVTEKRTILVFDALNHKQTNFVDTGHSDCVNCARFLDSRTLATCSDDTTVALWDIRYLKRKVRTLKGHSNWVKNIEYSDNTGLLVTSGFDGSIYTWDINKYTEGDTPYKRAFHTSGLMRTKLTPDSSKLIMSTTGGYMMVIHNLNLHTLASDLQGFKPNTYRIVQLGDGMVPSSYAHNHLFTAKRNRIELISDFPQENDAEMIASLQVHPQGWSILSRNTSSDENSEWTCVHDIQDCGPDLEFEEEDSVVDDGTKPDEDHASARTSGMENGTRPVVHFSMSCINDAQNGEGNSSEPSATPQGNQASSSADDNDNQQSSSFLPTTSSFRFGNVRVRISHRPMPQSEQNSDILYTENSLESGVSENNTSENTRTRNETPASSENQQNSSDSSVIDIYTRLVSPDASRPAIFIRTGSEDSSRTFIFLRPNNMTPEDLNDPTSSQPSGSSSPPVPRKYRKVPKNRNRLTHYIEEPNVGRSFIKELCFSADGRLVCSPFGYGVRLLAFNPNYSELSDCVPKSPVKLYEAVTNISHSNVVVSTKFSPTHNLLVSGCLSGKINFHQPML